MIGKYETESAAKKAANNNLDPIVIQYTEDGSFDWFPQGHPVGRYEGGNFVKAEPGRDYINVAQWRRTASGHRWSRIEAGEGE